MALARPCSHWSLPSARTAAGPLRARSQPEGSYQGNPKRERPRPGLWVRALRDRRLQAPLGRAANWHGADAVPRHANRATAVAWVSGPERPRRQAGTRGQCALAYKPALRPAYGGAALGTASAPRSQVCLKLLVLHRGCRAKQKRPKRLAGPARPFPVRAVYGTGCFLGYSGLESGNAATSGYRCR